MSVFVSVNLILCWLFLDICGSLYYLLTVLPFLLTLSIYPLLEDVSLLIDVELDCGWQSIFSKDDHSVFPISHSSLNILKKILLKYN